MDMDEWRRRDPQAGCACTPQAYRGSPGMVSTPYVMFSNVLLEDFIQKNLTHNQNTEAREALIHQSHSYSTKACSAVTRLSSCSVDTLTSLIFPNEEELSYKPGRQQGLPEVMLRGTLGTKHQSWWSPQALTCSVLSVPQSHIRPPRIRPSHLMALVASAFGGCVSSFSKFHF